VAEKTNRGEGTEGPRDQGTGGRRDRSVGDDRAFAEHPRLWGRFDYVYPVVSRRSHGLSIGINLNPDKACNFDCIYCCVNRAQPPRRSDVDLAQVDGELRQLLQWARPEDGRLWGHEPFSGVSQAYRRINDIAFSGDGEPTAYGDFGKAVDLADAARRDLACRDSARHDPRLPRVKLIVITNATLLDRPRVREALERFDPEHDEVWAKLDAGTEAYFRKIDRAALPLRRVLDNIRDFGRQRPVVLQSLFLSAWGQPLPDAEFEAYLDRVAELRDAGCRIKLAQLYTVARATAEQFVGPLTDEHMQRLGVRFREHLADVPVEVFCSPR
jgi:wyosine [tRNA(Phe)-imidazoG37] synthetase (radical SAM superfamily)